MTALFNGKVLDQGLVPIVGADIYVYDYSGGLADLTDSLGQVIANPLKSGVGGYYEAYAADGIYTSKIYWQGRHRYTEANVTVGSPEVDPFVAAAIAAATQGVIGQVEEAAEQVQQDRELAQGAAELAVAAADVTQQFGSAKQYATYSAAVAAADPTGTSVVIFNDPATHTALSGDYGESGGQTPNTGLFLWTSGVGLVRTADTEAVAAGQYAEDAADSADAAAATALSIQAATDKIKEDQLRGFPFLRWVKQTGFYFGDKNGNYIFGLDGQTISPSAAIVQAIADSAQESRLKLMGQGRWVKEAGFYFGDRSGNYTGKVDAQGVAGATGSGKPVVDLLIADGQSVSNPTEPGVNLTTSRGLSTLSMFNGGVTAGRSNLGSDTEALVAGNIASLVPLASTVGETFVASAADALQIDTGGNFIAVTVGVNGKAYTLIQKGTTPYANLIACVNAANALVTAQGATLRVSVLFQHGEADFPLARSTYRGYLDSFVNDLNNDIIPITGQAVVHVFAGQSPSLSASQIPLAAFDKAKADTRFHVVGPLYDIPLLDAQHPTGIGQHYVGRQYARAIKRVLFGRFNQTPYQPKTAVLAGTTITVVMEGQTGLPQIDTTGVSDRGTGKGFEFFDDSGSPPSVSAVSATGTGYTLTLSGAPSGTQASFRLRTAFTAPGGSGSPQGSMPGARTNLCDQDGLSDSISGSPKALPNRCVISEITVTV